jgi:EpsI family protein
MADSKQFLSRRYGILAAACLILVLQASASRMLKIDERALGTPALHDVPLHLGKWNAKAELSMDAATVAYLKPDDYILRDYTDELGSASTNLFVAYFKSLQNVYGPHSPSVCLPGAGWIVTSSKIANVAVPGRGEPIPVNEFTMEKSNSRILVLYWYQNDRAVWAQEFQAKLRLLPDLLRYRRSDVSLVRVITALQGTTADAELANSLDFTKRVFPVLAERLSSLSAHK